jgi:cell division control protein 45
MQVKVVDDGHGEMEKCPTSDTYDKMNQLNEIDLDSDPEDYEEGAQGRQKREMKSRLRAQREVMGRAISNYYSHQFFGQPSSHSAYQLVRNLNKANNEYLWFAIVGMTSMFIEQKLSKEALDRLTQLFQADAAKSNSGQPKDRGEIASRKGFQFALLDHWSLYDSMLHSSYLFAKMQLWQDRGLTRLH